MMRAPRLRGRSLCPMIQCLYHAGILGGGAMIPLGSHHGSPFRLATLTQRKGRMSWVGLRKVFLHIMCRAWIIEFGEKEVLRLSNSKLPMRNEMS